MKLQLQGPHEVERRDLTERQVQQQLTAGNQHSIPVVGLFFDLSNEREKQTNLELV